MSEKFKIAFVDYTEPSASSATPPSFNEAVQSDSPPVFRSRFASITRNALDRIRLINFSEAEMAAIHEIIRANWERGIDKVYPHEGSREFKLRGSPWGYDFNGQEEALLLVLRILEALYNVGWVLYSAIEVTNRISTKDSLVFRYQDQIPPPCEWISVSFHSGDKLKILNKPPPDLTDEVIATFITEIQRHEVTPERTKIRFKKLPWKISVYDDIESQLKLISLLEVLERHGFTLYARTTARYSYETNKIPLSRRKGLGKVLATLDLKNPDQAAPLADGSPEDKKLRSYDGFSCLHCKYRTINLTLIIQHYSQDLPKYPQHPRRSTRKVDTETYFEYVYLQIWASGSSRAYWIVERDGRLVRPAVPAGDRRGLVLSGRERTGDEQQDLINSVKAREYQRNHRLVDGPDNAGDAQTAAADSATTYAEQRPWLERTRWETTYKNRDRSLLRRLIQIPYLQLHGRSDAPPYHPGPPNA
ncbi:hypothetical protein FOVSG1_006513 [Fusarium oxysporum f. sp. vasinfectum]